jgi:N-acetylglucosaminyl-diphospho-decaprenol L-rhamnosyltransferase
VTTPGRRLRGPLRGSGAAPDGRNDTGIGQLPAVRERVLVAVVTYNSERLLEDLVASLRPGLSGVDWHLVVADNASADATVKRLAELAPEATVVEMGRNAGYAAGINAAVAASPGHTAILILNPDVRLTRGCVASMLTVLRRTGSGSVVPRLADGDGEFMASLRREPTVLRALADACIGARRAGRIGTLGEAVMDRGLYDRETTSDWAEGSTLLVDRACWDRCGPWDESFFLYSEETEFLLRARDAGFVTRLAPLARAVHLGGESESSPSLWALLTVNRARLFARRHNRVHAAAYWAALLLRESSRGLMGNRPSRQATRALLSPSQFRGPAGPWSVNPDIPRPD